MVWCSHCLEDGGAVTVPNQDYIACIYCGKLFECPVVYERDRMIGKRKKNQVARYLHNKKEKRLRKIIWEEMHKDYLEPQKAKKAAVAAAAEGTCQARLANGSEELLLEQELATPIAASLEKSRKEKKHKHPPGSKSSTFAKSHGGTCHELSGRKDNIKKQRTASDTGECENDEIKAIEETQKESKESVVSNAKDSVNVDGDNDNNDYYNNKDDEYYGNEEDDYYEQPDEEYGCNK